MNHEMAAAVLPLFLSTVLGAPAFALGVIEGVAFSKRARLNLGFALFSAGLLYLLRFSKPVTGNGSTVKETLP